MRLIHALAALALLAGAGLHPADARPGRGTSLGSRGSRTYSLPPPTATAPNFVRPMDRSLTARSAMPSAAPAAPYPMNRPYGMVNRHPFMTGFAGGLLGAGLFGLLSGHGLFGGVHGLFSFIGFLIQIAIIGAIVVWLLRRFGGGRTASSPGVGLNRAPSGGVTITPDDYRAFERLLLDIQAAWSAQNLRALNTMVTPEMVSHFSEQLADYASRGARNVTSNVRFQRGDLSEAWREGNLTYATVAMQYSLTDVTTDMLGHVVDGSATEPMMVTELWTFVRADGRGNWILSAIQQAG